MGIGDIAADLLAIDDLEGAHLEVSANEVFIHVVGNALVGQSVHTERVSVVSGKLLVFKVA